MVQILENIQKQREPILDQIFQLLDFQGLSIRIKLELMLAMGVKQSKIYNEHTIIKLIKNKILTVVIEAEDSLAPIGSSKQPNDFIMKSLVRELIEQQQLHKFENLARVIVNLYRIWLLKFKDLQQWKDKIQFWIKEFTIAKNDLNGMKRMDDSFGKLQPYIADMHNILAKPCLCGQQSVVFIEQGQFYEEDTCKQCQRQFHKLCYEQNEEIKFECRYCCLLCIRPVQVSQQLFWITLKESTQGYKNQFYFNLKKSRLKRVKENFQAKIQVRCLNVKNMQAQWPRGFCLKVNSKHVVTNNTKNQQQAAIGHCSPQNIFMTNSIKIKIGPAKKGNISVYLFTILLVKNDQKHNQQHDSNEKNIENCKKTEQKNQEFSFRAKTISDQPKDQSDNNNLDQYKELLIVKRDDYLQDEAAGELKSKPMQNFGNKMLKLIQQAFTKKQ